MNLKQLEYFVRVAELGSFSRAALILNIAQPALSRQVRLLETDLHTTLLIRTGRGVLLTESGKRLFDHSIGILQLVTRAGEDLEAARHEPLGRIVVGLPPSVGRRLTLPLVECFRRTLPRARLAIVEGLSAHLTEWISTGRVDLGIVLNPESDPALEITPLLSEPLGLVGVAGVAKGRSAKLAPVDFAELPGHPLIVPERTHTIRKLLETSAALAGLKLDIALEVSSVQSILDLVRAGYGHAVLAESALAASGRARDFTFQRLRKPDLISTLCLAKSAHKPSTPLAKCAFDMLRTLIIDAPDGAAETGAARVAR